MIEYRIVGFYDGTPRILAQAADADLIGASLEALAGVAGFSGLEIEHRTIGDWEPLVTAKAEDAEPEQDSAADPMHNADYVGETNG